MDYYIISLFCISMVTETVECGQGQFKCSDDSCIGLGKVCDGHQDCMGGLDEHQCSAYILCINTGVVGLLCVYMNTVVMGILCV